MGRYNQIGARRPPFRAVGCLIALSWIAAVFPLAQAADRCLATPAPSVDCSPQPDAFCPCPQDELWLVSTRQLCGSCPCYDCLRCQQLCDCQWQSLPIDRLIAAHQQQDRLTIIYIHGNRTDLCWAVTRGKQVYQSLFSCCTHRPVRFVIWHWPADPSRRFVKDFFQNAQQSVKEGRHLAWFLGQTDPAEPIGLIGYSLGAQVILSALERTEGRDTDAGDPRSNRRVALIASATHCSWPSCGQFRAIDDQFARMLVVTNCSDRALRAYQLACDHCNRAAGDCGRKGVAALPSCDPRIRRLEVAACVGPKHSISNYVAPAVVRQQVRAAMLSNEPQCGSQPTGGQTSDGHFE